MWQRLVSFIILFLFISFSFTVFGESTIEADEEGDGKLVYIIPIEKEVERGLEAFLVRATNEAIEANANQIVFEIDTPGGLVDSAGKIATLLQGMDIPTSSFIVNDALSAGSYIALNTDTIYMAPHSKMGASGVITSDGSAADKKAQSAWLKAMKAAAESRDRDPLYAEAMANENIDLPDFDAGKGEFLTLTPQEAVEVGYSEGIVKNRTELLFELDLSNATIIEMETTFAEEVARFITNPVIIPILLSVASLGLVLELYSPGFGVPGSMGLAAIGLFFYGHFIAGLAGMEAILLLFVGIGLIIAEFFVTGGILGLLGAGSIVGSLYLAGYDIGHMSISIAIALVISIVVAVILFRFIGLEKGIFRHIVLRDRTTTDLGYVSSVNRLELIGLEGITATQLRPAGTAVFDNERIDVVSESAFIEKDRQVKIVKVEGMRVVVRELT